MGIEGGPDIQDGLFPVEVQDGDYATAFERDFVVSEKALISLALLQVNWDAGKRSYLDNFMPFTLEALRRCSGNSFSAQQAADAVGEHFGIALPVSVVKTILNRVPRQKGRMHADGQFTLNREALDQMASLWRDERRYGQEHRNLAQSLMGYAQTEFGVNWTLERAERALLDYVEANASLMLASAIRAPRRPERSPEMDQVVIASWIEMITTDDPQKFDYLLTLVKGSLLAAAVFDPGVTLEKDLPFRNTKLVLDTPVILKALGYEGDESKEMVRETLDLAQTQKATLVCFDRTLNEARGVVRSAAASLAQAYRHSTKMSAVARHFGQLGSSPADVERLAETLEVNLRRLGIEIVSHPDHSPGLTVDERALEDLMRVKVKYQSDNTLRHDLDALAAIHRMRRESRGAHIETCRAVFITTNRSLVRTAVVFPDFTGHEWPLATLIDDLATIVWVKRPMSAPDLPRHRLLAACLSVLSPSEADWDKYLTEVERLRAADRISAEDVALLRHSQESRQALLRQTVASRSIDETLVLEVLQDAQAKTREPVVGQLELIKEQAENSAVANRSEMDRLREQLAMTEQTARNTSNELHALRDEVESRASRDARLVQGARLRGQKIGRYARWGLMLLVLAVALPPSLGIGPAGMRPWAIALGVGCAVIPMFAKPGEAIEHVVSRSYVRHRLRSLGLDEAPTG